MVAMRNQNILIGFIITILFIAGVSLFFKSNKSVQSPLPNQPVSTAAQIEASPTSTTETETTNHPTPTGKKVSEVNIFLVAIDDGGKSGKKFGCNDSIVPVKRTIQHTTAPLRAALQELLSIKTQQYGQSGLYNALYQSNLSLQSAVVDSAGKATVKLAGQMQLGGECDNPRFQTQLEETVSQFPTVKSTAIFINNLPLEQAVSLK